MTGALRDVFILIDFDSWENFLSELSVVRLGQTLSELGGLQLFGLKLLNLLSQKHLELLLF